MNEEIAKIVDVLQKGKFHSGTTSDGVYIEFNLPLKGEDNTVALYFDKVDNSLTDVEITLGRREISTISTDYVGSWIKGDH